MSEMKATNTTSTLKPNVNVVLPEVAEVNTDIAAFEGASEAEINLETSRLRLQAEKLRVKKEYLELEKLQNDIEKIRNARAKTQMSSDTVNEALAHGQAETKYNQEHCTHMKGGASEALLHGAISQGNDASNYAMIEHTFTSGIKFRMCQRCGRTWFPKDADYRWAMSRPTKNSASGSCSFPSRLKDVRMVSEIPHDNVERPVAASGWSPEDSL